MPLFLNYTLGLAALSGLVFWFWQACGRYTPERCYFWPALLLKLACGLALGYFYDHLFDTHRFQTVASDLTALFFKSPEAYFKVLWWNAMPPVSLFSPQEFETFSNSFFFIKVLSLVNFLTGSLYFLNSLYFSFFSFAACWYFVQECARQYPGSRLAGVVAFLFFPSVVFWTSGVLKDGFLVATFCIFWATVLKTVAFPSKKPVLYLLLILVSAWLMWKVKYFVAVLVYGLTGLWLFWKWAGRFSVMRSWPVLAGSLVFCGLGLAFALSRLHEHFSVGFFLDRLVWNYEAMLPLSEGRPAIRLTSLKPEISSVMINLPKAVWGILFRPYFWEGDNLLYFLAGLENAVLLLFFAGIFLKNGVRGRSWPSFYLVLLVFSFILAAVFALATPNLGSLSRYRTAFLPFLIFVLLQSPFWQRSLNRLANLIRLSTGCR